jgi:DinB superfamily
MDDNWQYLAQFMYGDLSTRSGFWYSHSLREVAGLSEEQLYWTPGPKSLCILWQVGHIAHRERLHIGVFLQGFPQQVVLPYEFDVFGAEWISQKELRGSAPPVERVFAWANEVRTESQRFIASLSPEDFARIPPTSAENLSVARWLFITACHTSLHIGRIQLLRALIEETPERAC